MGYYRFLLYKFPEICEFTSNKWLLAHHPRSVFVFFFFFFFFVFLSDAQNQICILLKPKYFISYMLSKYFNLELVLDFLMLSKFAGYRVSPDGAKLFSTLPSA